MTRKLTTSPDTGSLFGFAHATPLTSRSPAIAARLTPIIRNLFLISFSFSLEGGSSFLAVPVAPRATAACLLPTAVGFGGTLVGSLTPKAIGHCAQPYACSFDMSILFSRGMFFTYLLIT